MRAPPQVSYAAILVCAWEKAQPSATVGPKISSDDTFCVQIALYAFSNRKLANKLKKFETKQECFKTDSFIWEPPKEYFYSNVFHKQLKLYVFF